MKDRLFYWTPNGLLTPEINMANWMKSRILPVSLNLTSSEFYPCKPPYGTVHTL